MILGHGRARCEASGKGTTEFWTQDTPPDDTWKPNRHNQHIKPLFRNNLNQIVSATHPPFENTVAQAEHGRRDSTLSFLSRAEDAKEEGWTPGFGGRQNYPTCPAPTTTVPPVPQHLKMLLLKQQTQAVNEKILAKGCRHPLVNSRAKGTGKGTTCQLCGDTRKAAPKTLVSWRFHRIKRVVTSATAAEAMGLSEAIAQGDWMRALWSEVVLGLSLREWRNQENVPHLISVNETVGPMNIGGAPLICPQSEKTYNDRECSCAGWMERLKWQMP